MGGSTSRAFRSLIDWHIAEGTSAIVVVGTTGESPTVDFDEQKKLFRSPSSTPRAACRSSRHRRQFHRRGDRARRIGARRPARRPACRWCLLQQADPGRPYQHFRKIAETVDLPMILYNVPVRTITDLQNDTVLRLAQVPGIIGIKDATSNMERGADLIKRAPRNFAIYSGDDAARCR
jgi:4-hydroxy-tetrahydrodipicolinate synthase